jgi:lipopolysaccharide/colanic/teichoic acid biosynthesis glycosyltransferase
MVRHSVYRGLVKPLADVLVALTGLILLSPIILLIGIVLAVAYQESPFFTQLRPGRHGKLFRLVKFKSMNQHRDAAGILLPDAERLSGLGRFIRKTSLDELPQLLNVLAGQMSVVGPRPLLPEYLPLYNAHQSRRHLVKPGITGWAQVNGRNAIGWEQKFDLDVWYVQHQSFVTDMKILWLTLGKVFRGADIAQQGAATMEKFTGTTV